MEKQKSLEHNNLIRIVEILRLIPEEPTTITTQKIVQHLHTYGFEANDRMVQRILKSLQANQKIFPLEAMEDIKPYQWYWIKGFRGFDIPAMNPQVALSFLMMKEHISNILPQSTLSYLNRYFSQADQVLNQTTSDGIRWWKNKVQILPDTQKLLPAEVHPNTKKTVFQSLFESKQITINYQSKNNQQAKPYTIHPLGIVMKTGIIYIVCVFNNHKDTRHIALHRIKSATLTNNKTKTPKRFTLKTYIQEHIFEYPLSSTAIKLSFTITNNSAKHLQERKLSHDQKITQTPNGRTKVSATVPNTEQLRWWLLAFGDKIEVLTPKKLRTQMKTIAKNLHKQYSED